VVGVGLLAGGARAETQRLALLVANHEGGAGLETLRYSARDAGRLREVLTDLGGFERADIIELVDARGEDVIVALEEVARRVDALKARGDDIVFVFYYSGHAANGVLHLGKEERLAMTRVKGLLEQTEADVRLAFVDSCGAGAMTRQKGASLAPPFVVKVDDNLKARGQVIIASSSADEASQESDDIQGSFFTHYLTTGMRGDADNNGDGRVALDEAYAYAYGRTVAATAATRTGAQHPTYAYDLTGAGDVTLTRPGNADVVLQFGDQLEGQYFVVDLERQLFVAELDKSAGSSSRIALPRGQYAIKKRLDTHLLMKRVDARNKGVVVVDESNMEHVDYADDYAKGSPIYVSQDAGVTWSLALGAGGQIVVAEPTGGQLFPSIGYVSLEGRAKNLFGKHVIGSIDVAFGTREHQIQLGGINLPTQYSQAQIGGALMYEVPLGWGVSVAGGARLAGLVVTSQYLDGSDDLQFYMVPVPGLQGVVGWQPVDWFHVEAMVRPNMLVYTLDGRNLAYLETGLTAWVDF
jgi:hypothetical protein